MSKQYFLLWLTGVPIAACLGIKLNALNLAGSDGGPVVLLSAALGVLFYAMIMQAIKDIKKERT